MKLQEIFDQLTYGELSQLQIGGLEDDGIQPEKFPMIINHINLALGALYRRFPLKEGKLVIQLHPGIYTYKLKSEFSPNNLTSFEDIQYIEDTEDSPFIDDIIKVERVYTDTGRELGLNNELDEYSVHTPSLHSIQVPEEMVNQNMNIPTEIKTSKLTVVYRATHPILETKSTIDPKLIDVELPYSHLEPLLYFVASRLHNPIGMTNEFHAGNSYAAKYEQACQQLELQNVRIDTGRQTNDRLTRNGWV